MGPLKLTVFKCRITYDWDHAVTSATAVILHLSQSSTRKRPYRSCKQAAYYDPYLLLLFDCDL